MMTSTSTRTLRLTARSGGLFVDQTGDVVLAYLAIGAVMVAIPLCFAFSSAWKMAAPQAG